MATVTTSKIYNLSVKDWLRGLLVAVITGPVTIILQSLDAGSLTFNWKSIGIVALSAGLSYVVKNWLTPSEIVIKNATPAQVEAVKDGSADAKIVQK